jgi:hypothetical protein
MLRRRGKVDDDAIAGIETDGSMLLPCMAASGSSRRADHGRALVQDLGARVLVTRCSGRRDSTTLPTPPPAGQIAMPVTRGVVPRQRSE